MVNQEFKSITAEDQVLLIGADSGTVELCELTKTLLDLDDCGLSGHSYSTVEGLNSDSEYLWESAQFTEAEPLITTLAYSSQGTWEVTIQYCYTSSNGCVWEVKYNAIVVYPCVETSLTWNEEPLDFATGAFTADFNEILSDEPTGYAVFTSFTMSYGEYSDRFVEENGPYNCAQYLNGITTCCDFEDAAGEAQGTVELPDVLYFDESQVLQFKPNFETELGKYTYKVEFFYNFGDDIEQLVFEEKELYFTVQNSCKPTGITFTTAEYECEQEDSSSYIEIDVSPNSTGMKIVGTDDSYTCPDIVD